MQARALVLLAFVAVASAQTYNAVGFCERYTTAIFGSNTAANQGSLINAVVTRALQGVNCTSGQAQCLNNVTGILWTASQMPFFTSPTNYYTNSGAYTTLVAALNNFFEIALNCRLASTTTPLNMATVHSGFAITQAIFGDFINVLVKTLTSFGVPLGTGLTTDDMTYISALMNTFGLGAAGSAGAGQICNQAGCNAALSFAEVTSGTNAAASFAWLVNGGATPNSNTAPQTVTIQPGGNVHFNIGSAHNVVETDSSFTTLSGGRTSGAVGAATSYTVNFPTSAGSGTWYFKCSVHASMQLKVVVGSAGAAAVASMATVLAAVAIALLSKRV